VTFFLSQISLYCVCAIANGVAFVRWQRQRQGGSLLYGWFSGLAFCGSCAGAVAYGARMQHLTLYYSSNELAAISNPTNAQLQLLYEQLDAKLRWCAAFYVVFPLELLFTLLAKLTVLHRMHLFSGSSEAHPRLWFALKRTFLAIFMVGSVAGFIGNFTSAVYWGRASNLMGDAAAAYATNSSALGQTAGLQARQQDSFADAIASAQRFCEVCVLLAVIIAFTVVGIMSSRIIASALRRLFGVGQRFSSMAGATGEEGRRIVQDASAQGKLLQRKVIANFVFVFFTVLVRSTVSALYATAMALQNNADPCSPSNCHACHNAYSNIQGWILYTPEYVACCRICCSHTL